MSFKRIWEIIFLSTLQNMVNFNIAKYWKINVAMKTFEDGKLIWWWFGGVIIADLHLIN